MSRSHFCRTTRRWCLCLWKEKQRPNPSRLLDCCVFSPFVCSKLEIESYIGKKGMVEWCRMLSVVLMDLSKDFEHALSAVQRNPTQPNQHDIKLSSHVILLGAGQMLHPSLVIQQYLRVDQHPQHRHLMSFSHRPKRQVFVLMKLKQIWKTRNGWNLLWEEEVFNLVKMVHPWSLRKFT